MRFLILILFLLPAALYSQVNSTCTISGHFYSKGIYYGGIDISEEGIPAVPMADAMFYLVRYRGADLIPEPVQSFTTAGDGSFSVQVAPGQYGFITFAELDSLKPGQWLPAPSGNDMRDLETATYVTWETSSPLPVTVTTHPVKNITIVNWSRTYCYICP